MNLGTPQEMTVGEIAAMVIEFLGWEPKVSQEDGLRRTLEWFTGKRERGVS